jgi:hypothetical protein
VKILHGRLTAAALATQKLDVQAIQNLSFRHHVFLEEIKGGVFVLLTRII